MKADNVSVLAGGVAFYLMLSLFPFAIAALSVYGLVANPDDVTKLVQQIQGTVPDSVVRLLEDQLGAIAESSRGSLTFGLVGSVLFALWSASKGASALIKATNVAFDEGETRGFLRLRALALGLTLAFLVVIVLSVALIAVVPSLLAKTPFGTVFSLLRWPA
ncbi:MAG: YihY/virulence factor BrkB family protein, partial [Actinomycetota bacterium]|nr:YihY/virulence factor BrkB family protein [Actinomycetota bacterium]